MSRARRVLVLVFSWGLLAAVVAGALALIAVPKATDAKPLTVLSGSMAPTYHPGDVVMVRPTDTDALRAGDVITFQPVSNDPRLTTHRIESVLFGSEGRQFVTRGDANNAADLKPVEPAQVKGEVWYSVPFVGYASALLAGGWARTALDMLAIGLLLYGGWFLAAGLLDRRRRSDATA